MPPFLKLDTLNGAVDESTYNPNNPNNLPCGVLVTAMNSSQSSTSRSRSRSG